MENQAENGNRTKCLIIDDEPGIRSLCRRLADSLGFECTEVSGGQAALDLTLPRAPDIVLCDLLMPDMGGQEFLERAKHVFPNAEMAIMSGSCRSTHEKLLGEGYTCIQKPFRMDEMRLLLQGMEDKVKLTQKNYFRAPSNGNSNNNGHTETERPANPKPREKLRSQSK